MSIATSALSTRKNQLPTAAAAAGLSTVGASAPAPTRGIHWGRYALRSVATVAAAVLANSLFYYLGGALIAYDPEFVVLSNVSGAVIFTVAPAIVAVILYATLLRFTRHPASIFMVISAIVFVVTLIPDFTYIPTVPGSSNAQTAVLVLMHVIAAAVIVRALTNTPRDTAR